MSNQYVWCDLFIKYSAYPERYTFEWLIEDGKKYKRVTFKDRILDYRYSFFPGDIAYFYKGDLHRENLPAVISRTGAYFFRKNKLHNESGPAIIYLNGKVNYYIDGEELTETKLRKYKLKRINEKS